MTSLKAFKRLFRRDELSGWTASGVQNSRAKNLMFFGGFVSIAASTLWSVYYASQSQWGLLVTCVATALAGLFMLLLTCRNCTRLAGIFMAHVLIVAITVSSLADIPADGIPRSIHMYMLPLSAAVFFLFNREGIYLRIILPLAPALIFLAFSIDIPLLRQLDFIGPSAFGVPGVWINNITALSMTAIVAVLMQADFNARRTMETDMRRGIAKGEFELHFQPQADRAGHVVGFEALLRWNHSARGNISPKEFIPIAEETGLIIPIGEWVLRMASAQLVQWGKSPETADLTLAVNVSAVQFRQPDFVEQVKTIVSLSGAKPGGLKLELTESALVDDSDIVHERMQALRDFGIQWSLDDFGTGYSSLSQLKRFPFEQIKIDQSFVRDLLSDKRNMAIVETIIRLARNLNLSIIAEGVETEAQLQALSDAGCALYQ
ncbi:MAG: EAL domain-containing protein, partial [Gammaproteobacteria bacterium]|nr:EAL domain-containing protein [Gammaproteobacteria bacterium]